MRPFSYERATTPAAAAAAAARNPDAKFIAGGTNLLDLMKLEIEKPAHLIDVNGLALDKIEALPDGGLRIGALVRNTDLAARRARAARLSAAVARLAGRRIRAAAQQGDDRGQSPATHALPVFLRHQPGLQQADPGSGCAALQGFSRQLAVVGIERRLHRDASFRHGDCDARARCDGRDRAAEWRGAEDSRSRNSTRCPATRRISRTRCSAAN